MAKSPYADLPEPLKKQLPKLFASYPELCGKSPSSWFVWTKDKVHARNAVICHASLSYDGEGWDELITAVPKNDELSLEYLRMLIRGPFRSVSDLIRLDRVKDNYYLHCLSLDKWPANVLMNFCIASRVPIEFSFFLEPWAKHCEKGFDPTLAFLLTYSYGYRTYGESQYETRLFRLDRGGHMWLDPASSWSNILNGTMVKLSKPFKTHPQGSRPTNIIWGICKDYLELKKMSDEQIAEFYQKPISVPEVLELPAPKKKFNPYAIQWQMAQPIEPDPPFQAFIDQMLVGEVAQQQPLQPHVDFDGVEDDLQENAWGIHEDDDLD